MKKLSLALFCFLFLATISVRAQEYAEFTIGEKVYTVEVSTEVIASMDAGAFILLGPTDGKGKGLAIMIPNSEISEYTLQGGYTAPAVTVAVSSGESYTMESGMLTIEDVKNKYYIGHFEGTGKLAGSETTVPIKGKFKVELDM